MKLKIFFIFICLSLLNADDFKPLDSNYEDWIKNEQTEFVQYQKNMDEEFAEMLKKDWDVFMGEYAIKSYEKPKPKKMPKTKEKILTKVEIIKSPKVTIKPIVITAPKPIKIKPIKITPKIKKTSLRNLKFNFYSQSVDIKYDTRHKIYIDRYTKGSIANYWNNMSRIDYKILIKQLNNYSNNLNFNDWAKYQLIHQIGSKIHQDENLANLFTWFILSKMGYDMKVGFNNSKIYLLANSENKMFQVSYFTLGDKRYYVLNPDGKSGNLGQVFTYNGEYPNSNRKFSLDIKKPIKFTGNVVNKPLRFSYNNQAFKIDSKFSKALVNFYKTYPQADYKVYFDAQKSSFSYYMLSDIKSHIQGKSELEAVNFLLRLTQKSFEYKTDPQQFGYEKVFFPEETLSYPYSDCEDRSIFFSFLVKKLLNLNVVGIKYSNHLAAAVAFSGSVRGDGFMHNGKKYTITDPTFINANAGSAMPQYKGKNFKIISQMKGR